jgi:hypothetical protein
MQEELPRGMVHALGQAIGLGAKGEVEVHSMDEVQELETLSDLASDSRRKP